MDLKRLMALADLAAETKHEADELKEAIAALSLTESVPSELLNALALGAEERLMRNPDFPVRAVSYTHLTLPTN